jgi:CubicO group peptidase (beta-lactamase class C family)
MTDTFIKKIKVVVQTLPIETEVAISISEGDKTSFIGLRKTATGIIHIDNKTTAFEIGSVTKTFTGNLLAKLLTESKIKIDDCIDTFLAFRLAGDPPITFKHLGLHTSGLPRMPQAYDDRSNFMASNPFSNFTENDFINYLEKDLLLESTPGKKASYTNLGFALLSYAISKLENKVFSQLVKEKILDPLNMQNTVFDIKEVLTEFKNGLDKSGNKTTCWDGGLFNGSLGMISTAEDLSKFARMMLNLEDEAVNVQTQTTFPAKSGVETCLGWLLVNNKHNERVLKINGGTAGSSSSIFINQKAQKAFTFCSNIHPDTYMALIEHRCIEAVTD